MSQLPPTFPSLPPDAADGLAAVAHARPLSGGSIASVWDAQLTDGTRVVVKATGYDAHLEAEGLEVLRTAGADTPRVLSVSSEVLMLEHVAGGGDPASLGAAVATVHRDTGERFGWHRDNVIGPLPQRNDHRQDWPSFYADLRLAPYLDELPTALAARVRAAVDDGRLDRLLDHDVAPSLVHGDLWHGNIVADRWLIDPAVHHADRELDLAMLDLFGGVPEAFQRGYDEVWPLDDGWRERRPALQLYHLLVHVRLFGAGYVSSVSARLDRLGW